MSETAVTPYTAFVLPSTVVTKIDLSHLAAEVEQVDNEMTSATVRAGDNASEVSRPVLSQPLADLLAQNKLSVDTAHDRSDLIAQLRLLKDKAPVMHMTFAVVADRESLESIVQWVRESVHPQAVISTGLQPSLVAGVYLRTPNHVFDLSLRGALTGQHGVLVKELEGLHASN